MHTQICKNILKVNRATPNNSCRAELGQYPLLINIQKRAVKFQQHLRCSDPSSYQTEALQWQEQNLQKSALLQLVLTLHPNQHNTIRPNHITQLQKHNYITYWKDATTIQKKMELYLHLKRDYKPAEYLSCIKDHKLRKTLTKYRLSDHCLAIERGRHRPQEQRLCSLCSQKELETEEHFLLHCDYYHNIRAAYFHKLQQIKLNFMALPNAEKLSHILGENSKMITTAARYVSACHKLRLSASGQNWSKIISCMLHVFFVFSFSFFFFFFYNVLNIVLVCGKKKKKKRKYTCTYLLNYFTDLFLFYVLYNCLFLIHVMDNALAILCKSCQ